MREEISLRMPVSSKSHCKFYCLENLRPCTHEKENKIMNIMAKIFICTWTYSCISFWHRIKKKIIWHYREISHHSFHCRLFRQRWWQPHLHSMWSMDGPHTPLSVYLRVIYFGCPYTCVMYGIRQCNRIFFFFFFTAVRLVHSLLKYIYIFFNNNNKGLHGV